MFVLSISVVDLLIWKIFFYNLNRSRATTSKLLRFFCLTIMNMAKLGYTWYPKDWGNSESVFELTLSERGLYREFIDLAMLNDNKTEVKKNVWIRKFFVSIEDLDIILNKLESLNLIEFKENILFIKSCEPRLNLVRGGSKGGKNKPIVKPILKPLLSLEEKNVKPILKQREIESKLKEKESNIIIIDNTIFSKECIISEQWIETMAMQHKISIDVVKIFIDNFENHLITMEEQKKTLKEFKEHFSH